ncbi:MAG: HNH endonuclease [Pyrinomonadaceae bacterium]
MENTVLDVIPFNSKVDVFAKSEIEKTTCPNGLIAAGISNASAPTTACPKCGVELKKKQKICPPCQLRSLVETNIAKRRITFEQWQNYIFKSGFPANLSELTPRQAHRARLELCGLIKKNKSAARVRLNRLAEDSFSKDEIVEASKNELPSREMQLVLDAISIRRASSDQISPTRYREAVFRQGSRCYWCWTEVVRVSEIEADDRIKDNFFTFVFYASKKRKKPVIVERGVATIDHLVRAADGGTNNLENLVVACVRCNQRRGREAEGIELRSNWFFGSKSIEHGFWQQCPHCRQNGNSYLFSNQFGKIIRKIKNFLSPFRRN